MTDPSSRTRYVLALSAVTVLMVLAACRTVREPQSETVPEIDPRLTNTAYIEEGDLVAFVVDTFIARMRRDRDYIPLEIGVANKGVKRGMTLTLESFILIDASGRRYPAASRRELTRNYGSLEFDSRFAQLLPVMASRFRFYDFAPSALTRVKFDRPAPRRLFLQHLSFAVDLIYFPRPATPGEVELFMSAPELEDEIFVRFPLPAEQPG